MRPKTNMIKFSFFKTHVALLQWTALSSRLYTLFYFTLRCPVCHRWMCKGLVFPSGCRPLQPSLRSICALHEGIPLPGFCRRPSDAQCNHRVSLLSFFAIENKPMPMTLPMLWLLLQIPGVRRPKASRPQRSTLIEGVCLSGDQLLNRRQFCLIAKEQVLSIHLFCITSYFMQGFG